MIVLACDDGEATRRVSAVSTPPRRTTVRRSTQANTAKATPNKDEQDSVQLNIGTSQSAVGEDPSVEDDYKGNKDDPGTTHPADTEDGEKYGSVSFREGYAKSVDLANQILADLANGFGDRLQPSNGTLNQPASKTAAANRNGLPQTPDEEMAAGYELSAALGNIKEAMEQSVQETLYQTIKEAQFDADLFGAYYTQMAKQAMDDGSLEGEDHSIPGDETSGAGSAGGMGGGGEEEALNALLAGGGGEGGMPGDAMGGMGGGMDGGMGGGEPSEEEALQELVAALEELGIPLEALAEAGGAEGGGEGGPGMEGPPPGPDMPMGEGAKLAAAARNFKLSGKYRLKAATTQRERQLRDIMKSHIRELVGLR